ncbi:alpha/beta hydrolase domain-containing protein [Streptomyces specialis]|uniref:alpha/beta hydrolase domain-containing protein n=1 Tax=Streptomyces specialis TaxID=498367 RepID=UPI00073F81C0|nr:alpha/beta hydrolase domain-containing protein [Streptomyces specialis]
MPRNALTGRLARTVQLGLAAALLCGSALITPAGAADTTPAGAPSPTPIPDVTGPIPQTADSHAFGAAAHQGVPEDLRRSGYVEEEYFLSGEANVYDWPEPGPAVVRTADVPYTTRMLVRRPANPRQASGNVVVEMLNPSAFYDLNIGWAAMRRQIIENGDVWVGVTIKPISIDALQDFDPERYAPLSMANPLPPDDPRNCTDIQTLFPGDSTQATENGLVWDIYSQVGALLHSDDRANPLRRQVEHLYGFGYSQTGGYLYTYVNAVHPLAVRGDGRPLYDGYIVGVSGGAFVGSAPINQCSPEPPLGDPRRQFEDVGVPIMHAMAQTDFLWGIDSRRPDSDEPADRYRHYELAGAAHATAEELIYSASAADVAQAGRTLPAAECNEGPRSRLPGWIFWDAILRNLDQWVRHDIAPPHADPIQIANGQPALDEFGNVIGGVRSPYLDVPTSTWNANSTGSIVCPIAGHEVPFTAERLAELYPTHGAYVRAVTRSALGLIADRHLTPADGMYLIREAVRADIP